MGIFSKLFGGARSLTRMADATSTVVTLLNDYEQERNDDYLLAAAWVCRVAILQVARDEGYDDDFEVGVKLDGHIRRLPLSELRRLTVHRVETLSARRSPQLRATVAGVLGGGKALERVQSALPDVLKQKFLP